MTPSSLHEERKGRGFFSDLEVNFLVLTGTRVQTPDTTRAGRESSGRDATERTQETGCRCISSCEALSIEPSVKLHRQVPAGLPVDTTQPTRWF